MFAVKPYRRDRAVAYAHRWALSRNPLFQNFAGYGGDCTNFVSQCLFAGSCVMNLTPTFGWYYDAPGQYAPAWSGVPFLYNFLIGNMEEGPFARETDRAGVEIGDLIQLGMGENDFYHTLIVTGVRGEDLLVSAHNNDALDRPLSTYTYERARFLHIAGVRIRIPEVDCCFDGVYAGTSVFPSAATTEAGTCLLSVCDCDADTNAVAGPETDTEPNVPPAVSPSDVPPPSGPPLTTAPEADRLPADIPPEDATSAMPPILDLPS